MSEFSQMLPRYAIVDGVEAVLEEVILHLASADPVAVFKTKGGERRYATAGEWLEAANRFDSFAADRGIVTSGSGAKAKISLYRSLFRGRSDVHACGYLPKNGKSGKISYAPACRHEKNWNVCPRKVKRDWSHSCADCKKREFLPLSDEDLKKHFKGESPEYEDVLGLYVLDESCRTWVLVADFDGAGWKGEVAAYRDEGRRFGVDVAVERSRSGDGAHGWIFFDEPIEAGLARDLGSALLSSAMARTSALSFKSYDRFFPAQETIPKGGFGNLISLPLQGQAMKQGNSMFVDDDFEAYSDQWRFLSGMKKVTRSHLQVVIEQVEGGPLGPLAFAKKPSPATMSSSGKVQSGVDPETLSPVALTLQPKELPSSDFPPIARIVKSNMLFVPKEGLSPAAQNKIRRLAAFGNPEFYKAQALRQSVRNKPRIINLGEDVGEYIAIPRGCEQKLRSLLAKHGVKYEVSDLRNAHAPIQVEFLGQLRSRQQIAVDALLHHEDGILSAPTGFGKTVIGAYLIAALKMRTLIIVPDTALLEEWQEKLDRFIRIDEKLPPLLTKKGNPSKRQRPLIGRIGGGKNKPSGIVDVATYQSLLERSDIEGEPKRVRDVVQDYDLIICDECHHGAAPQLERVLRTAKARRVYGLSATPKRTDGLEGVIYMQCGPIRHKVDPKEQAAEQSFVRRLVPRFTRIRLKGLEKDTKFTQVLEQICAHEARNRLIAEDVIAALSQGKSPFVVTSWKDHAKALAAKLEEAGCKPYLLIGEGSNREKAERILAAKGVSKDDRLVIVGTGKYVGEGFDLPRLDALFLTTPFSSESVITQYSGRLHRESEGKQEVVVYDYVDSNVPMLDRMYRKRIKSYAKLGYEVVSSAEGVAGDRFGMIVGPQDFQALLTQDISMASKSVLIAAPYANSKFVDLMTATLKNAVERGIDVSVSIRKPSRACYEATHQGAVSVLESLGCDVQVGGGGHVCIAVVDEETVWYGNIPLLAFAGSDDYSIRVKSCEVAHDLLEDMKRKTDEREED